MTFVAESDADRVSMFEGKSIRVAGVLVPGLKFAEPFQAAFDDTRMNGEHHFAQCLTSDARKYEFKREDPVEIPGDDTAYSITEVRDEDGMALLELRTR